MVGGSLIRQCTRTDGGTGGTGTGGALPHGRARSRIVQAVACAAAGLMALVSGALVWGVAAASPAGAAGAVGASSGGANTNFQFSAEPFAGPGAQQRAYFSYELLPGHRILDQVVVLNKSNAPESFIVYPEDATNVPNTGAYAFQAQNKVHNTTVGRWVTVGNTSFTVPPGQEVVDTFQLSIPSNAPPGDHVGAVVVQELHNPAQQQNPVGVNLILRFAVPMYVRVVGKAFPGLTIEDLTVFHQSPAFPYLSGPAKTAVRFKVVNTGNDILDPKSVTVSITGLISGTIHTYTIHQTGQAQSKANPLPLQMLPGGNLSLTEEWSGLPPFDPLTAHVSAVASDPNTTSPVTAVASTSFWYFPWIVALIVLLIIAAIVARFTVLSPKSREARRARKAAAAGGAAGAGAGSRGGQVTPPGSGTREEVKT